MSNFAQRKRPASVKFIWIFFLSLFCLIENSFAQSFTKTFGGTKDDGAYSVIPLADGGFAVMGNSFSYGTSENDINIFFLRLNDKGDTLRTKIFGMQGLDWGNCMQKTSDGGFIIVGNIMRVNIKATDVLILKINSSGEMEWQKNYGGDYDDHGHYVSQTHDGGYIVCGYTNSFGAGWDDIYLLRLNDKGDTLWTKTFGGDSQEEAYYAHETKDGGIILAGYTRSLGFGGSDGYVMKTDKDGKLLWHHFFGGADDDWFYGGDLPDDRNYIFAGYTRSEGAGGSNAWLVKIDSLGRAVWKKNFGGKENEIAYCARQLRDGGFILAGSTSSSPILSKDRSGLPSSSTEDFYIVRTDSTGEKKWIKTFGGKGNEIAYTIQELADGEFIAAGFTESFGNGGQDMYIVKFGE